MAFFIGEFQNRLIAVFLLTLLPGGNAQNDSYDNFPLNDDSLAPGISIIQNTLQFPVPNGDLISSIINERYTPRTTSSFFFEYDYIVIGSGPGGSTVSARLSEIPCVKVLLLEAGKIPTWFTEVPAFARVFFGTDIDWKYLTVPQKHTGAGLRNRQVAFPAGKAIGGSSVWNAMLYVRGNKKNFNDWARGGATGWSYEEVLPYFKKTEQNMNPKSIEQEYHGFNGPVTVENPRYSTILQKALLESAKRLGLSIRDINGEYQKGFFIHQATTRNGRRCSAAKAYLVPSDHRPNLDIISGAFVTKIVIENNTATGVEFDYRGKRCQVRAKKEVILSAGAINSAQLLMLSGIGPRKHLKSLKIPVIKDLPVGKNLQDHCAPLAIYELSSRLQPLQMKIANPINLARYILNKSGPFASTEGVNAIAFMTNQQNTSEDAFPDHELYFLEGVYQVARDQTNIKPEYYDQVLRKYENSTMLWCIAQLLHPKSKGTVTLRSTNPYDSPKIDPNYLAHPQDVRDVVEGMKNCNRLTSTEPMRKLGARPITTVYPGCEKFVGDEDLYLTCVAKSVLITLSHQAGTVKMGNPKDPTVVVDPKLKVLGIEGLRVVDSSIMPAVISGNTAAATYMIGEKAADMIKETITCTYSEFMKRK